MKNFTIFLKLYIFLFNPLTVTVGYIRHASLTFLWSWTPRRVPRSAATHALFCNIVSTDKLCSKTVNFVTLKGLKVGSKVDKICTDWRDRASRLPKKAHNVRIGLIKSLLLYLLRRYIGVTREIREDDSDRSSFANGHTP